MAERVKYNVKDPKYFDAKNLADYLAKELREKDFKFKYEAPKKKDTAIGAMTEPSMTRGGTIKVMGNPAKIAGKLPDGWTYDPATNRFKNGNKAEPEYFDVEPLKKDKPLKEVVDMSDVMYMVRNKRPDLRVRALDTTTFGIDGSEIDNIDWKRIFGSKFQFDKATGTIQGETSTGQKLSFHVMTESAKTLKKDEVREATYTSNEDGIMQNGFSEGNRTSVEHTAQNLLGALADMNPQALLMQANLHTFSPSDARHLWETCNLVPDPVSGELAVQDRDTGVIHTDNTIVSQLAIMYSLVSMSDRSNSPEDNPLLNVVTRGEINWERFDEMFAGFVANPNMLGAAMGELTEGLEAGDNAREMRLDAREAVEDVMAGEGSDMGMDAPVSGMDSDAPVMPGVELKAGGGLVHEANIDDDKKPMSYEQLAMLDFRYERHIGEDGRTAGVYDEKTGSTISADNRDMHHWMIVKDALDFRFGRDEEAKAKYWNSVIAQENWQSVAWEMCQSFEAQQARMAEMEDDMVMTRKNPNNGSQS